MTFTKDIVLYYGKNNKHAFYESEQTEEEEDHPVILQNYHSNLWLLYLNSNLVSQHDTLTAAVRRLAKHTGAHVTISPQKVWQYPNDIPQEDADYADMVLVKAEGYL